MVRWSANRCNRLTKAADMRENLEFPRKSEDHLTKIGTGPTRIRTWNQGIMSPLLCR